MASDTFKRLKEELDESLAKLKDAKRDERRELLAKIRWLIDHIEAAMGESEED
jgi:hypothetical protein